MAAPQALFFEGHTKITKEAKSTKALPSGEAALGELCILRDLRVTLE
jgi:hypothetical protein